MEAPNMNSGNTRQITAYTLIERVRDAEYPDTLYAMREGERTGKYWYSGGELCYEGQNPQGANQPFDAFLADYNNENVELRFEPG